MINLSLFITVKNQFNQYSIQPINKEVPIGWIQVGRAGEKEQCISYINESWKDIRPSKIPQIINEKEVLS